MRGRIIHIQPGNTVPDSFRYFAGNIYNIIMYEEIDTPHYYYLGYNPTLWKIIITEEKVDC
jgi:hypothetical protein